jgi:hypothetical protein
MLTKPSSKLKCIGVLFLMVAAAPAFAQEAPFYSGEPHHHHHHHHHRWAGQQREDTGNFGNRGGQEIPANGT